MKRLKQILLCSLLTGIALSAFSGCTSTRMENGVQIQKQRSWSDYIPYL